MVFKLSKENQAQAAELELLRGKWNSEKEETKRKQAELG